MPELLTGLALSKHVERLRAAVADESLKRDAIRKSDKYVKLQEKILKLTADLDAMCSGIPDSAAEYDEAQLALIDEMKRTGDDRVGNFVAHYRHRKAVNGARLFNVLGNDIGLFMEIATVSQKNLNEFAKGNPDLKKELVGCVEDAGKEIDSLTFLDQ